MMERERLRKTGQGDKFCDVVSGSDRSFWLNSDISGERAKQ